MMSVFELGGLWLSLAALVGLVAWFLPPLPARILRAMTFALAGATVCMVWANLLWGAPDCTMVPWWVLWCEWPTFNAP